MSDVRGWEKREKVISSSTWIPNRQMKKFPSQRPKTISFFDRHRSKRERNNRHGRKSVLLGAMQVLRHQVEGGRDRMITSIVTVHCKTCNIDYQRGGGGQKWSKNWWRNTCLRFECLHLFFLFVVLLVDFLSMNIYLFISIYLYIYFVVICKFLKKEKNDTNILFLMLFCLSFFDVVLFVVFNGENIQ